jgi:hypothetical protein
VRVKETLAKGVAITKRAIQPRRLTGSPSYYE